MDESNARRCRTKGACYHYTNRPERRLRGSNSHILADITGFEPDKHANFANLRAVCGNRTRSTALATPCRTG